MADDRPIVAVLGASGAQGSSVVRALQDQGKFQIRALTRSPDAYAGPALEVVGADLKDPASLQAAFDGAHGVFAVTNFWEPGADEVSQGRNAVEAAAKAGVEHYVWSTLPDVEALSNGRYDVAHFTSKGKVDQFVREAGFPAYTFVEPPFYFENLIQNMPPQPLPDGRTGWAFPLAADERVVHMGSVEDVGSVVAGALANAELVGSGSYLSSAAALMSFGDVVETLNAQGHSLALLQVPDDVFAGFFPGAAEIAQMMGYWREFTYLGPTGDEAIALARKVSTSAPTDFATWARQHMPA
ncbi:MAG: NmrA/HSCARG family protein [Actinomycetes bacterium]